MKSPRESPKRRNSKAPASTVKERSRRRNPLEGALSLTKRGIIDTQTPEEKIAFEEEFALFQEAIPTILGDVPLILNVFNLVALDGYSDAQVAKYLKSREGRDITPKKVRIMMEFARQRITLHYTRRSELLSHQVKIPNFKAKKMPEAS